MAAAPPRLRTAAISSAAVALAVSLASMLYAGRGQKSVILTLLFSLWVAAPFAAVIWANIVAVRWPAIVGMAVSYSALVLPAAFAAFYAYVAFAPAPLKIGFVFLVTPVVCWVAMALPVAIAIVARRGTD